MKKTETKSDPEPDLSYIEPGLRHLAVPISSLKPNPRQVNEHNERSIAAIARSLKKHGQKKNAVANTRREMVAGWGTVLAAAERNGWTHLAVVFSEEDDQGLDEYALEDNRSAKLSEPNEEKLLAELERLGELGTEPEELGWDEIDLEALESALDPAVSVESRDSGSDKPTKRQTLVTLVLSTEQAVAIESACSAIMEEESMTRAEALEKICRAWTERQHRDAP